VKRKRGVLALRQNRGKKGGRGEGASWTNDVCVRVPRAPASEKKKKRKNRGHRLGQKRGPHPDDTKKHACWGNPCSRRGDRKKKRPKRPAPKGKKIPREKKEKGGRQKNLSNVLEGGRKGKRSVFCPKGGGCRLAAENRETKKKGRTKL